MPGRAKLYIAAVFLAGLLVTLMPAGGAPPTRFQWTVFFIITVLATAAHLFKIVGPNHESWHLNLFFYYCGLLLITPLQFVAMVAIAHSVEWGKERLYGTQSLRRWYIQPFNIMVHILSGAAALGVMALLNPAGAPLTADAGVASALLGGFAYLFVNHLLVGQALYWARGIPYAESGVWRADNLLSDITLIFLGLVTAIAWLINPYILIPAFAPLLLLYRGMQVPALMHEAQTDEKTGLWNIRRFRGWFQGELNRAVQNQSTLALVMADLDYLRNINNRYGHLGGDAVLADLGKILREVSGSRYVAARFGGEEFCVALPHATQEEALRFGEELRRRVAGHAFHVPAHVAPIHVTISVGIAFFPQDAETADGLIHIADMALYQAKYGGRNRVCLAGDTLLMPYARDPQTLLHTAPMESLSSGRDAGDDGRQNGFRAAGDGAVIPRPARETVTGPDGPAAPEPASTTSPTTSPASRPPAQIARLIGLTFVAALGVTGAGLSVSSATDWPAMLILAACAFGLQLFQIPMYGNSSVSSAMVIAFGMALVGGFPGVLLASTAITLAHWIRRRSPLYKEIFNWSAHLLAGAIPATLVYFADLRLEWAALVVSVLPLLVAALAYFLAETLLIATAIAMSKGVTVWAVWQEEFRWLAGHYLVAGLAGYLLALVYTEIGLEGVALIFAPVLLIAIAQQQYLRHTRTSVDELRRMNRELKAANAFVETANAAMRTQNEDLFMTLAHVLDARDQSVHNHSRRVAKLAMAVADKFNLSSEQKDYVRQAAYLHDIGKLGVPEAILLKPDSLTPEEFQMVREHSEIGARMLQVGSGLRHLAPIVRHHHERWDGRGYPDGLSASRIPLESRILALCDSVDAMASERPYGRTRPLDEILDEIRQCAGAQFDPAVVDAFLAVVAEEGPAIITEPLPPVAANGNGAGPLADGVSSRPRG